MIFDTAEILPAALSDLTSLHRDIALYVMALKGKRRPAYCHAFKVWSLGKQEFDDELATTMALLRAALKRRGIHKFNDLGLE
jgi:hypothetical protein